MIMELIMTLLPDPVDPAISRCGMVSSAATRDAPVDVLAQRNRQVRVRILELVATPAICRSAISSRLRIRHLDAHRRLARNALDQDRFGLQAQAEIFA